MSFVFYPYKEITTGTIYEVREVEIDLHKVPHWEYIDAPYFYDSEDSVWNRVANEGKIEAVWHSEWSPREIFDVIREMAPCYKVVVKGTSPEVNNGIFHFEESVKYYHIQKHEVNNCKVLIDIEKGCENLPHESIN